MRSARVYLQLPFPVNPHPSDWLACFPRLSSLVYLDSVTGPFRERRVSAPFLSVSFALLSLENRSSTAKFVRPFSVYISRQLERSVSVYEISRTIFSSLRSVDWPSFGAVTCVRVALCSVVGTGCSRTLCSLDLPNVEILCFLIDFDRNSVRDLWYCCESNQTVG